MMLKKVADRLEEERMTAERIKRAISVPGAPGPYTHPCGWLRIEPIAAALVEHAEAASLVDTIAFILSRLGGPHACAKFGGPLRIVHVRKGDGSASISVFSARNERIGFVVVGFCDIALGETVFSLNGCALDVELEK